MSGRSFTLFLLSAMSEWSAGDGTCTENQSQYCITCFYLCFRPIPRLKSACRKALNHVICAVPPVIQMNRPDGAWLRKLMRHGLLQPATLMSTATLCPVSLRTVTYSLWLPVLNTSCRQQTGCTKNQYPAALCCILDPTSLFKGCYCSATTAILSHNAGEKW